MIPVPAPSETHPVVVALGSNLGDSPRLVREAMDRLEEFSTRPILRSSLWSSTPVDCPPGSPRFVNAVILLAPRPGETPETLLPRMQDLEREFGRRPKVILNEARPLDLDLIGWGREVRNRPELTLPHPRVHLRRFVLAPLAEIDPGRQWPGQTAPAGALLDALRTDEVLWRLEPSDWP